MTDIIWKDRKHWAWFPFSFTKYKCSETRLFVETGLMSTNYLETQLYRIVDVQLKRTLGNKIFGTGTITLTTRDKSSPILVIKNVKNSQSVKEMLVQLVEAARKKNFVREVNVGGGFDNFDDVDGNGIPDIFDR